MKPDPKQDRTLDHSEPPQVDPENPSAAWVDIFQEFGFPAYPVRVEDDMVCIMAPAEDCPRLLEDEIRKPLIKHGKALGYRFITLDIGHFSD